ncbi:hypothetical protein EVA_12393 [gut metagenome]|uniref:Uncharacterized protein n=1 Tax=gut metagenome TaxID=749906 RepID=J9FWX0_9ZZZZ
MLAPLWNTLCILYLAKHHCIFARSDTNLQDMMFLCYLINNLPVP